MADYAYPIRSYDIHFSEEHWQVLEQCAKKVAKIFDNRVEVGDLITEGWLGYARHFENLYLRHNFVFKRMYKWANAWLHHTLLSVDDDGFLSIDKFVIEKEIKTSEEAEEYLHNLLELTRRARCLSNRDRAIVFEYCMNGSMVKVARKYQLSREYVRLILKKVAA